MRPGGAAVCPGVVWHRRDAPVEHSFRYPVSYAWFDPGDPTELVAAHRWWSARRPAPVWFRRRDYGIGGHGDLASATRKSVAEVLGATPAGPVRVLTQLRRWGWLFNPLTAYVVWDGADGDPVAVVLEVTNTPWKERHQYTAALVGDGDAFEATFPKRLHVSPFFGEDYDYRLRLSEDSAKRMRLGIDLVAPDGRVELTTELSVTRVPATRRSLRHALWTQPMSTHRVSAGIHAQALRLVRRGVTVVPRPAKRVAGR